MANENLPPLRADEKYISDQHQDPMAAWFLGPKAEHAGVWAEMINYIFQDYVYWRKNYFLEDPIIVNRIKRREHDQWFDKLTAEVDTVLNQLKSHFPFFSPRYVAHMLSEQTLPSVLGYFAGMLYNPNNVTYEAAPITVPLELEVGKMVAEMLGYNPHTSWSHITSGGTIANTEALWVARTGQFNPLMVQEYCKKERIDFSIKMPNEQTAYINDLSYADIIALRPHDAIVMVRALADYLINKLGRDADEQIKELNQFLRTSKFNINNAGLYQILSEIKMKPQIFVSEAAHYCIKKAANVLGYGEDAIRSVPVNSHFRMNTDVLQEMLFTQSNEYYTASVIGIAGTTEEGSVDPIHTIKFIRDSLSKNKNRSFWLHIDAAWGGYFRSLFMHPDLQNQNITGGLDEICNHYIKKLDIQETFTIKIKDHDTQIKSTITWGDAEVYKSFLAMPDADSITIDPHKMGYIPYPCGIIAFKNGVVTELIAQKAPYISDETIGIHDIHKPVQADTIGPYILEGSKPGAAAAAAWLAHKTIPLESFGHGKIIKASLLSTRKLHAYLHHHKSLFKKAEELLYGKGNICKQPFTFKAIYEPADTNVVCFVVMTMQWEGEILREKECNLQELNALNEKLHRRLTIKSHDDKKKSPHAQEYFVSKTKIESSQYAPASIQKLLQRFLITDEDYISNGIFVLRSTIMNPWYKEAADAGKDYLMDFIMTMHQYTREILNPE